MKKLFLLLILAPAISFAENVNFVGVDVLRMSILGEDIDGYQIGYMGVFDEKTSVSLAYGEVSEYGLTLNTQAFDLDIAYGSFSEGSVYAGIGLAHANLEGIADSDVEVVGSLGFSKRSGVGIDYDVSVSYVEDEAVFGAYVRGPIGDSGFGWSASVATQDDVDMFAIGVNYSY